MCRIFFGQNVPWFMAALGVEPRSASWIAGVTWTVAVNSNRGARVIDSRDSCRGLLTRANDPRLNFPASYRAISVHGWMIHLATVRFAD